MQKISARVLDQFLRHGNIHQIGYSTAPVFENRNNMYAHLAGKGLLFDVLQNPRNDLNSGRRGTVSSPAL